MAFRDRWGHPRPIGKDDVRRIVSNWPEYSGAVVGRQPGELNSKARSARDLSIETVHVHPDRAVFPLRLLIRVGRVRLRRALERPDHGVVRAARVYPLNPVVVCAQCVQPAKRPGSAKKPDALSGNYNSGKTRYRHNHTGPCTTVNLSVSGSLLELEFGRLLDLLMSEPISFEAMQHISMDAHTQKTEESLAQIQQEQQEATNKRRNDVSATN